MSRSRRWILKKTAPGWSGGFWKKDSSQTGNFCRNAIRKTNSGTPYPPFAPSKRRPPASPASSSISTQPNSDASSIGSPTPHLGITETDFASIGRTRVSSCRPDRFGSPAGTSDFSRSGFFQKRSIRSAGCCRRVGCTHRKLVENRATIRGFGRIDQPRDKVRTPQI